MEERINYRVRFTRGDSELGVSTFAKKDESTKYAREMSREGREAFVTDLLTGKHVATFYFGFKTR